MNSSYAEFSALMKRKAFREAADFASRRSSEAGERDGFWLTQLSAALRDFGKVDEALVAADKACALAPRNPWALIARAEALLKKGEIDGALDSFREALPDARAGARARKGCLNCLAQKKEWERLLEFCSQYSVSAIEAFTWKVRALIELGRNADAETACDEILSTDPDHSAALWKKCELRVAVEGVEPVLKRFSRLAKIPGKPAVYSEINAWLCKRSGNLTGAIEQYETLSRGTGDPSALRKQAFMLAKSGHEDQAIPLMEELLRLAATDMYLHPAYIAACSRLGALDRAWKFYHELLALHPECKSLYGRLNQVRKAMEKISPEYAL